MRSRGATPDEARVVARLVARAHATLRADMIDSAAIDDAETMPEPVIRALADIGLLGIRSPRSMAGSGCPRPATPACSASCRSPTRRWPCWSASTADWVEGHRPLWHRRAKGALSAAAGARRDAGGLRADRARDRLGRAEHSHDGRADRATARTGCSTAARSGSGTASARASSQRSPRRQSTSWRHRPPTDRVHHPPRHAGLPGRRDRAEARHSRLDAGGARLRAAPVPADHVLGQVGKGFAVAVNVLNAGRLSLAAGCAGGCKMLLDDMTQYASTRVQFGHPLADYEITQRKLATPPPDAYAADAMVGALSAQADRHDRTSPSRPPARRSLRARRSGARPTRWCRWPAAAASSSRIPTSDSSATRASTGSSKAPNEILRSSSPSTASRAPPRDSGKWRPRSGVRSATWGW